MLLILNSSTSKGFLPVTGRKYLMANESNMGNIELWLGASGSGKSSIAMELLHQQIKHDWRMVRLIVPTVGHKRKIEENLLTSNQGEVLFADPVNIFFTFAQQVARRGGVTGNPITEMQKYLLLKRLIQQASLDHFSRAAQFPGFVQALSEIIDELKVQMITPDSLLQASIAAKESGAESLAKKLAELGDLYNNYQQLLIKENLFDNEGIMWLAAECLRSQGELLNEIKILILDGFARMTPIQLYFLRALAPRINRVIVLFDYEEGRTIPYHPVQNSLDRIFQMEEEDQLPITFRYFSPLSSDNSSLTLLRQEIYRERKTVNLDDTVRLFAAATQKQEIEMIARDIHQILHAGKLPDGTPIGPGDIAIIARDAEQLRSYIAHTFSHYGLPIKSDSNSLAHTIVGRVLLALLRLFRDNWKREDVLLLLKSGFLPVEPTMVARIDMTARTHALREGKASWSELWPDDESAQALNTALEVIYQLEEILHQRDQQRSITEGIKQFLTAAGTRLLDFPDIDSFPWPDMQPLVSANLLDLQAAFAQSVTLLDDLQHLDKIIGGFSETELFEIISTALLRQQIIPPANMQTEISLLSVQSTAGEKYKLVYVCQLLQGTFPRRQRESSFIMDHEREETLKNLDVLFDSRKQLENDEKYWFLHSLSASSNSVVLSYAQYDSNGVVLESSEFLDEVYKVLPELPASARRGLFGEVAPPYHEAAHKNDYLVRLICDLRQVRDEKDQKQVIAAHLACSDAHGEDSLLARAFRLSLSDNASLNDEQVLRAIKQRRQLYSASQLQSYADCPFIWFSRSLLGVEAITEEFSFLDRGAVLHSVLERFYSSLVNKNGDSLHLEKYQLADIWPIMDAALTHFLTAEPRFYNRSQVMRDIELNQLQRLLRRFLQTEIMRAAQRKLHPALFERHFGDRKLGALQLGDSALEIQGVIDRVDLLDENPQQAIVVDYKSSLQMTIKSIKEVEVLQPPIYALALARRLGKTALGVEYINLKNGKTLGVYQQQTRDAIEPVRNERFLDSEEWDKWLMKGENRIIELVEQIKEGVISLEPNCDRCPDDCDYFPLCRGIRFDLQRKVRLKKLMLKEQSNNSNDACDEASNGK